MATVTISKTLEFVIDDDVFEDIVETASGVAVWQDECEIVFDEEGENVIAKIESENGSFTIDAKLLETAISQAINKGSEIGVSAEVREDIVDCIDTDDIDAIDAETADQLIQVACFGEVIYA